MLDDEPARVGTVATRVPAERRGAGHPLDNVDCDPHMLALRRFVDILIIDPPPAMACDFVAALDKRRGDLRIALQRHRDSEDGERQVASIELAQNAPGAGARPVLVDRFHRHVPRGVRRSADDFREKLLGRGIAVQHRAFAAFLVVENELNGDSRVAGPAGVRNVGAVASQISRITHSRAPFAEC